VDLDWGYCRSLHKYLTDARAGFWKQPSSYCFLDCYTLFLAVVSVLAGGYRCCRHAHPGMKGS
jgi:hypothetical protein